MGELLLGRARPAEAEAIFARLRVIAPDAETLCRHDDARALLESAGVGERSALLLQVATELTREYGGEVPEHEDDLRLLPGVGDYVQRAVLTFAFGRRQVLVDRTTTRIASRIARHSDTRRFQLRLDLHRLAGPAGPNAEFNRASARPWSRGLPYGRVRTAMAVRSCDVAPTAATSLGSSRSLRPIDLDEVAA